MKSIDGFDLSLFLLRLASARAYYLYTYSKYEVLSGLIYQFASNGNRILIMLYNISYRERSDFFSGRHMNAMTMTAVILSSGDVRGKK